MPINSFDQYPLTWKPDKKDLKPPYYRSLAAHLEQQITSGLLKPGTQLPPQREIADYLDLNYTTITRVYALCKKKGLIYGVTGKGTFVAPHAAEEDRTTGQDLAGMCIELGAVNGFSEYSQPVEQSVHAVMEKGYARHLFDYSFPAGHPHQLAAGARWLEQLGVHTDGDHLAISAWRWLCCPCFHRGTASRWTHTPTPISFSWPSCSTWFWSPSREMQAACCRKNWTGSAAMAVSKGST